MLLYKCIYVSIYKYTLISIYISLHIYISIYSYSRSVIRPAVSARLIRAEERSDHVVYVLWVMDIKSGAEWFVRRRYVYMCIYAYKYMSIYMIHDSYHDDDNHHHHLHNPNHHHH
jgi:hypothetical protein